MYDIWDVWGAFAIGGTFGAWVVWLAIRRRLLHLMGVHKEIIAHMELAQDKVIAANRKVEQMRKEYEARLSKMR